MLFSVQNSVNSDGVELGSSIGKDLVRFTVLTNGFFQELDGMFRFGLWCTRACYEAWMVV